MQTLERFIAEVSIKYRWLFLTGFLMLAALAAFGMRYLTFSNDSRIFFSQDNPQLMALETLEKTYVKVDNLLFILAPKSKDVFAPEVLSAVEFLTNESWKIPYSSRVDSLSNYQHTTVVEDDLMVADLITDGQNLSKQEIAQIKKIALTEPLIVNSLVDKQGTVTAVNINLIKPDNEKYDLEKVVNAARELKKIMEEKYPSIDIYLTGGAMVDDAFVNAPKKDMQFLVPLMFFLLLLLIAISLRSLMATATTLLVILLSATTGMGLAGWLGIELSPASANAPIIILTLAVADSIHILVTFFLQLKGGKSRHEAVKEAMRINFRAVLITSLTTAIGFLSMNFSDAPPFRDLGNIVAMGVMAALVYSIFLLPPLLAILPFSAQPRKEEEQNRLFSALADFVIKHQRATFWGTVLLVFLTGSGISKIYLNDQFIHYFDKSYDFRVASDFAAEHLSGIEIIDWNLDSQKEGGINDPDYLKKVDAFATWFRQQPEVRHVYAITDIIKRLNRNMHNNDPAWYKIPENRQLAAQYLLLYEMNLPFGLDLNDRINVDKSATRLTVSTPNLGTDSLLELTERGRQWLKDNAPELTTHGSGLSVIFSYISERNIRAMLKGSALALIAISIVMIMALKDIKLGLISLAPNLFPAIMAFGIWGYLVGQVGLAVSVMIAMTLGIVVDYSVHFLSKYQRARNELDLTPEDAVRYAFSTVGKAIWITTMALTVGFGVLAFSSFQINSHMGIMTVITIVLAMILNFTFLPTLLLKLESANEDS